jgi:N-dimethylarginine dimethylaminohydrolase
LKKIKTPAKLTTPTFLMNFPFTVDNRSPNNVLMEPHKDAKYNYDAAFAQFLDLYHSVCQDSLVYLLPSEGNYQDQPYVANLGCYLPHIKDKDVILLANFKSEPRKGEDKVGKKLFRSMGYKVHQPPFCWEGEADLKYIRDNIYVAGYGQRTDLKAHQWMRDHFGMDVIGVEMTDPRLYHLDCLFFPLTSHKALVATSVLSRDSVKKLEQVVEIVEVPDKFVFDGWTNNVRIGNRIYHSPARTEGSVGAAKELFVSLGFEPVIIDLWEFEKSGADLSCMIMHLNYQNYRS